MIPYKLKQGFSIVEVLIAVVIAITTTGSIMYGVVHLRRATDRINIEEKAFEQLSNYTEMWRTKIADGNYTANNTWGTANEFDLVAKDKRSVKATLGKRGYRVNGDFPYPLYSLETRIRWAPDPIYPEKQEELQFKIYQIEFIK